MIKELGRISIVARCPDHFDKVIYLTCQEAKVYGVLHRIRYGGKQQTPYRCREHPDHWHLKTNLGGTARRRRHRDWLLVNAWENEGGAL